jgi:hypothetical protein
MYVCGSKLYVEGEVLQYHGEVDETYFRGLQIVTSHFEVTVQVFRHLSLHCVPLYRVYLYYKQKSEYEVVTA